MNWIFFGRNGLRAGWAILIFVAIVLTLVFSASAVIRHLVHSNEGMLAPSSPNSAAISEAIQLLVVLIATWIMSLIERKPLLAYGYQAESRGLRLVSGLFWGFLAISTLVLSLDKLGYLSIDGRAVGGEQALEYALLWGLVFLMVGFFEESLMRGYLQFTLSRGLGFWWGAIILSFLFGSGHGHNPGESPVGLFAAGAIGLVFCLTIWYTGSLWWAVGFHAAWDWGESYFYGTADSGLVSKGHLLNEHPIGSILWSGGATGPEGSVLVFPLMAIMVIVMVLWWGRRTRSPFAGAAWKPKRSLPAPEPSAAD